jgi:predicted HTH domain antitoxin
MIKQITIDVPSEILLDLKINESIFSTYAKASLAVDLYKNKNVSIGYCSELAGMTKEDFITFLGKHKVSIFNFEDEREFIEEMNNA